MALPRAVFAVEPDGAEAAFLSVWFAFNLLSLDQSQLAPAGPYRQPATLRSQ